MHAGHCRHIEDCIKLENSVTSIISRLVPLPSNVTIIYFPKHYGLGCCAIIREIILILMLIL